MTVAPDTLEWLQDELVRELHTINLGIVGDANHMDPPEGYHIGAKTLRAYGRGNDYSLTYALDKVVTHDYACAIDIGGPADLQMKLGNRMVHALQNHDPRVYGKVRAINAPFDGVTIDRRWDGENPKFKLDDNIQDNSDRGHIHLEIYRGLVLKRSVMQGIFDVFAGIPFKYPPESPRWSETVDKAEVQEMIDESVKRAGLDLARTLAEGGDHGPFKSSENPALFHPDGYQDRLRALEKKVGI